MSKYEDDLDEQYGTQIVGSIGIHLQLNEDGTYRIEPLMDPEAEAARVTEFLEQDVPEEGAEPSAEEAADRYRAWRIAEELAKPADLGLLLDEIGKEKARVEAKRLVKLALQGEPEPLVCHDSNDLENLPRPAPLLGQILDQNTLAILTGKFGTLKTFLALDWSARIATGTAWEGQTVDQPAPVLYIAAEGVSGLRKRLHAWVTVNGQIRPGMLTILPKAINLGNDQQVEELEQVVVSLGAKLLVIDTLHKCTPGIEENSATEMGAVYGRLDALRDRTGCTVLLVHHTGHGGERARGSSALDDDVDTSWVIELADGESRSPGAVRVLKHRKSKEGELLESVDLTLSLIDMTDSGVLMVGTAGEDYTQNEAELIAHLDAAGMKNDAGRQVVQKFFLAEPHSLVITQNQARRLVQVRKSRT